MQMWMWAGWAQSPAQTRQRLYSTQRQAYVPRSARGSGGPSARRTRRSASSAVQRPAHCARVATRLAARRRNAVARRPKPDVVVETSLHGRCCAAASRTHGVLRELEGRATSVARAQAWHWASNPTCTKRITYVHGVLTRGSPSICQKPKAKPHARTGAAAAAVRSRPIGGWAAKTGAGCGGGRSGKARFGLGAAPESEGAGGAPVSRASVGQTVRRYTLVTRSPQWRRAV